MKILELFSGYGTASFALKQLGIPYELVGYSDIDKYANQCFQQNHGGKELGDCTKIDPSDLEDFDLLTGGFPCQAFSVAGKGLGEQDTRGTLFHEIIRIATVKKPRYMLLENVKGLMSKRHRPTFDKIISELYRIGYFVKWQVLNTKEHGIPQNRERVFFVCFKSWTDFCNYEWPEKEELKIFLKDILEENVDEKYYLKEHTIKRLLNNGEGFKSKINPEVGSCLFASMHKVARGMDMVEQPFIAASRGRNISNPSDRTPGNIVEQRLEPKLDGTSNTISTVQKDNYVCVKNATKKGYVEGYDGDEISLEHPDSKTRRGRVQEQIAPTLQCNDQKGVIIKVGSLSGGTWDKRHESSRRVYSPEGICPCIPTAQGGGITPKILDGLTIRKLTPTECFRLQGFLNDEVNLEGLSNTQRYKLAGNGQSVNVVKKIFCSLNLNNTKVEDDK